MQRFTDLKVWERSHRFVLNIYRLSRSFPSEERLGVSIQLRRASVSVPANIAEGTKRRSNADYARFLNMAEGSLAEAEYLLMLVRDLEYASADVTAPLLRRRKRSPGCSMRFTRRWTGPNARRLQALD